MWKQYVSNHIQPDSNWSELLLNKRRPGNRCPGQHGHAQLSIYLLFAGIFIPVHIWVSTSCFTLQSVKDAQVGQGQVISLVSPFSGQSSYQPQPTWPLSPFPESFCESCPKTWKASQGSSYNFSTDEPPWLKAMGHCAEEGAHLVIINSQAEQVRRRKRCFGGPWGQGKLMSLSPVESHADLHSVLHITYSLSWQV